MMIGGKDVSMLALAAAFGFVGGSLRTPARSRGAATFQTVLVRAARFELVDASGVPVAFWGWDDHHQVVLAFTGKDKYETALLGLDSSETGILRVSGSRGYASLHFSQGEKPILAMGDDRFATRLLLGFIAPDAPSPEDDDWGLLFRHPDLVNIGVRRNPIDGTTSGALSVTSGAGKTWSPPQP